MRDSVVMNEQINHRATRRARWRVLRHYPGVKRLGVNDRQWWILSTGKLDDDVPAYFCEHRITGVRSYLAQTDVTLATTRDSKHVR